MQNIKEANAYLQEATRLLHGSALAGTPFVIEALRHLQEAQEQLRTFGAKVPSRGRPASER